MHASRADRHAVHRCQVQKQVARGARRKPWPRCTWRSPVGPYPLAGDDQLFHRIFACIESRIDIRHRSSLPRRMLGSIRLLVKGPDITGMTASIDDRVPSTSSSEICREISMASLLSCCRSVAAVITSQVTPTYASSKRGEMYRRHESLLSARRPVLHERQ